MPSGVLRDSPKSLETCFYTWGIISKLGWCSDVYIVAAIWSICCNCMIHTEGKFNKWRIKTLKTRLKYVVVQHLECEDSCCLFTTSVKLMNTGPSSKLNSLAISNQNNWKLIRFFVRKSGQCIVVNCYSWHFISCYRIISREHFSCRNLIATVCIFLCIYKYYIQNMVVLKE